MIAKINTAKDALANSLGVKALYDSSLKQFILKTKDTGAKTQISILSAIPAFLDTKLGFSGSKDADYANGFNWNAGNSSICDGSKNQCNSYSSHKSVN